MPGSKNEHFKNEHFKNEQLKNEYFKNEQLKNEHFKKNVWPDFTLKFALFLLKPHTINLASVRTSYTREMSLLKS